MPKLKYLFAVQYKDGSVYTQNPDDVSIKNPERSCFYDVDIPQVHYFTLSNENEFCCVDLLTGKFKTHLQDWHYIYEKEFENRRLVYFRRVTKDFKMSDCQEIAESIEYHMGWSAETPSGTKDGITVTLI